GQWMLDPENLLSAYDEEGQPQSLRHVGRQVLFRLGKFPKAKKVYLAGSFNDWHSRLFKCEWIDGAWEVILELPPGEHTYKYVVDGDWFTDPHNPQTIDDGAGNTNSLLRVE
ncbi:MAG: glycogen-binding domain-containing protein, partial [Bacteroidota bacterium]